MLILAVAMSTLARNALPFGTGVGIADRALEASDALLDAPLVPEPERPQRPIDSHIALDDVSFPTAPASP